PRSPGTLNPWPPLWENSNSVPTPLQSPTSNHTLVDSVFYIWDKPNWLKVILTLGTTAGLWAFLLQQYKDILEYERRKG
uniref:NADH dehydrogenase [ubiquinone] 1 subunit C1, mitochondrial n=1 Tax=Sarcophilus harrisii TaxID=9305 RepID=A0A7N4NR17_SARHA